ncbi:cob(I)yrinic acid a,c-diamide adenosyltransferase [Carboxydocella sporoproducens DSM 16521]|uniref:Cob(I)yrinic acid a,c-diamide adenosyltransferase n=2 Tax=Carboxydocella TaxID=178898 RepID=A0A1T4MQE7_9FIRM|nr:cob(I)yrinic acid a,c-diamide adenosyltransferase [Carboxydocella thermautotrophica]SJZ68958.1 cob(I)yrinic acid a,c-diamide adenosyltransferase [Carboxydocella sporoproducens DSM 16521]GAW30048.1 Cob(I)yrinic acid a,c-diamide adenosyltransferase CobO [Carboxydocella sp. ULO1]GAW31212.1 Cob(I)yrinic acid a,c-diamide adenosyltransferase CobO [Carboxydocella sp. JDF658]AVX20383.1 cob(I)yrinic acid a,c-diamide adenosyltransferase [Carboxydocella thermautotrophica]AVX30807.1 cob(I)yrinic acid a
MRQRLTQGLIQVYTGNSKGKSTAAFGLALRAIGHGFKVYIIQFMKGSGYYGELATWHRLYPYIQFSQYGRGCPYSHLIRQGEDSCRGCGQCFVKKGEATAEDIRQAAMALEKTRKIMATDEFDIIILDEVLNAIYFELISTKEVLELINNKPPLVELVLTGRNAPPEIIAAAHLVTEMKEIKHPFQQGISARRGIEY